MEKTLAIIFSLFSYMIAILYLVGLGRRFYFLFRFIQKKDKFSILVETILIIGLLLFGYWLLKIDFIRIPCINDLM